MKLLMILILLSLASVPYSQVSAADDKSLNNERREAAQQRQKLKLQRNRDNTAALKELREYANSSKKQSQEQVRDLDAEFRIEKEELRADNRIKIAEADALLQQKISTLFLNPESSGQQSAETFRTDMKKYAEDVQTIKEQAAITEHKAFIDNEKRKNAVLNQRDQNILARAKQLGLLDKYKPILAKPIGSEMTAQEKSWNEREEKDIERLYESNHRYLSKFQNGKKLRDWEIDNKEEDFQLKQKMNRELFEVNRDQSYLNAMMMSPSDDEKAQQDFTAQLTEKSKQVRIIRINYDKINRQNRTIRQAERRKIMGY